MTRQARGRVAMLGLVLVVIGFGVGLASSRRARVRFWSWRMRSSDDEVRRGARAHLVELWPEEDPIFAELVALEAADRVGKRAPYRIAVGRGDFDAQRVLSMRLQAVTMPIRPEYPDGPVGWNEVRVEAQDFVGPPLHARQQLVVVESDQGFEEWSHPPQLRILLIAALPQDVSLARATFDATRARLAQGQ